MFLFKCISCANIHWNMFQIKKWMLNWCITFFNENVFTHFSIGLYYRRFILSSSSSSSLHYVLKAIFSCPRFLYLLYMATDFVGTLSIFIIIIILHSFGSVTLVQCWWWWSFRSAHTGSSIFFSFFCQVFFLFFSFLLVIAVITLLKLWLHILYYSLVVCVCVGCGCQKSIILIWWCQWWWWSFFNNSKRTANQTKPNQTNRQTDQPTDRPTERTADFLILPIEPIQASFVLSPTYCNV